MCRTCLHVTHMSTIQIRNVPDDVHRTLKARAAKQGVTLSNYMIELLEQIAAIPTQAEMRARLSALPPVPPADEKTGEG